MRMPQHKTFVHDTFWSSESWGVTVSPSVNVCRRQDSKQRREEGRRTASDHAEPVHQHFSSRGQQHTASCGAGFKGLLLLKRSWWPCSAHTLPPPSGDCAAAAAGYTSPPGHLPPRESVVVPVPHPHPHPQRRPSTSAHAVDPRAVCCDTVIASICVRDTHACTNPDGA